MHTSKHTTLVALLAFALALSGLFALPTPAQATARSKRLRVARSRSVNSDQRGTLMCDR